MTAPAFLAALLLAALTRLGGALVVEDASAVPPSAASGAPSGAPSLAYLVLTTPGAGRPAWAAEDDQLVLFAPDNDCRPCSEEQPAPEAARTFEPRGWWCAQRNYLRGVGQLLDAHWGADYFLLVDADTLVFRTPVRELVRHLEKLLPKDADLYMGDVALAKYVAGLDIVQSGSGVLLRGSTLRRLAPHLAGCTRRHLAGSWCWYHLDWVLGQCLYDHLGVTAKAHPAFQQFANEFEYNANGTRGEQRASCPARAVACHPYKTREEMKRELILLKHQHPRSAFTRSWARPCETPAESIVSSCLEDHEMSGREEV